MFTVKKEGIILNKTQHEFENEGVLNPAAIRVGDNVYIFYRAVRMGNNSTIGLCILDGPLTIAKRNEAAFILPEEEFECKGVEDPRIVKIDDTYYLTYTGYDGINALGALAISKDLVHFEKKGVLVPQMSYSEFVYLVQSSGKVNEKYYRNHTFYYKDDDTNDKNLLWDKNVIFFPRKINGKFVFIHRIRPGIQIVSVKNLNELTKDFWIDYFKNLNEHILMDSKYPHEESYIGGGCPPIETADGWILIYHGVKQTPAGFVYSACAALLDLKNPGIELARLPNALFSPEFEWELKGEVNNVVFPTGTAVFGETLFIYYGAADEHIACASLKLSDLLSALKKCI